MASRFRAQPLDDIEQASQVKFTSPRAQKIAQNVIGQAAEEQQREQQAISQAAAQAAEEQQRAQAEMKKQQAAAAEANRKMQVRAGAAAGMKTQTDVETGKRVIATHADGAPVFHTGKVGQPYVSPTVDKNLIGSGLPILGDAIDSGLMGRPGAHTGFELTQKYRDDRGQTTPVPIPTKVDPKDGIIYSNVPNPTTGQKERVDLGVDQVAQGKIKYQQQHAQNKLEIDARENAVNQHRMRFDPVFKPVADEREAAKAELEKLPPLFTGQGGVWKYTDPKTLKEVVTYDAADVERNKRLGANAEERFKAAQAAYDRMSPTAQNLERNEKEIKAQKLELEQRRIRHEMGLPDEDTEISSILAWDEEVEGKGGKEDSGATVSKFQPVLDHIQSQPNAGIMLGGGGGLGAVDAGSLRSPTRAQAAPISLIPPETIDRAAKGDLGAKDFLDAFSGVINPETYELSPAVGEEPSTTKWISKGGRNIGYITTDARANLPAIKLMPNLEGVTGDLYKAIDFTSTKGVPIFMPSQESPSTSGSAKAVAGVFMLINDPANYDANGKPLPIMATRLEQAGATPQAITQRVIKGELAIQHGNLLLKELYGTDLATKEPSEEDFKNWLQDTSAKQLQKFNSDHMKSATDLGYSVANRYERASEGKLRDTNAMVSLKRQYLGEMHQEAMTKPGYNRMEWVRRMEQVESGLNLTTGHKVKSALNTGKNLLVEGAIAPVLGMAAGAAEQAFHAAEAALFGDVDSAEIAKEYQFLRNRSTANLMMGWERNIKAWTTPTGRKANDLMTQKAEALKLAIDTESSADIVKSAVKEWQSAALAFQNLAPDEKWPITADHLDPDKDPALKASLAQYKATANPAHFEAFLARGKMSNGRRQLSFELEKKLGKNSEGFSAALGSGMYAGWEEVAAEFVSTALTFGASKALTLSAKAAQTLGASGKAVRLSRAAEVVEKGIEGLAAVEKFGIKPDLLSKPLTAAGRASNATVKAAKSTVLGAGSEVAEEWMIEGGSDSPNFGEAALGAVVASVGMAPISVAMGVGGTESAEKEFAARLKASNAKYAADYNKRNAGITGHQDITPEMAGVAQAFNSEEAYAAVLNELNVVNTQLKRPDLTPQEAYDLRAKKREIIMGKVERDDNIIEAAREIEGMADPSQKTFYSGIAKVASGNTSLLTQSERASLSQKQTQNGMPYFAVVNGKEIITDEARAEIAMNAPAVGALIQTTESSAIMEARLTAVDPSSDIVEGEPVEPSPDLPYEAPQASGAADEESVPQAARAASMEPVIYEAARQADPSLPEPVEAIRRAIAVNAPISAALAKQSGVSIPKGYVQQGATWSPPTNNFQPSNKVSGAQGNPATGDVITPRVSGDVTGLDATRKEANAGIARAVALFPNLPRGIDVQSAGDGNSAGAYIREDGQIVVSLSDLAADISGVSDPVKRQARIDAILNEEIVHAAQIEAAKRLGKTAKSFYGAMWGQFSAEQQKAAGKAYQGTWDTLEEWQKAAETVRMLVQQRIAGTQTELTKAFLKNIPQALMDLLREGVKVLREYISTGVIPKDVQQAIDATESLLEEFSRANLVEEKTAKSAQQAVSTSTDAQQETQFPAQAETPTGSLPDGQAQAPTGGNVGASLQDIFTVRQSENGAFEVLRDGKVVRSGLASQAEAENKMESYRKVDNSALNVTGRAKQAALERFPRLGGRLKAELEAAVEPLYAELEALPEEQRMAAADKAVSDRINEIADRESERIGKAREEVIESFRAVAGKRASQKAASVERSVIGKESPIVPKGKREQRDTPNSEMRIDVVSTFVDVGQLVGSSDPLFPGGALQPRNRSTHASAKQREEMVQNIRDNDGQHRRYIEGATTDSGRIVVSPLFGADGKHMTNESAKPLFYVVSGNGRRNALAEAHARKVSGKVEKGFRETAAAEGIAVEGMNLPVPVSVYVPDTAQNAIDLAEYSNRDAQLSVSNTEQAKRDAASIEQANILKLWQPDASGDPAAASNRDFFRAFATAAGDEGILDAAGNLTEEGSTRIERAMVAMLIGNEKPSMMEQLFNRTGALGLRAILGGISSETGNLLKLATSKPDFDLSPVLAEALVAAVQAKAALASGEVRAVGEFFDQGNLFDSTDNTAPERQLARALVESRSKKAVREILGAYLRGAEAVDTSTMSMFAEAETSREDLIRAALDARPIDQLTKEIAAEFGQNADLTAKLRIIESGAKRLPLEQRKAMNAAINAEAQRLRDGVISAPEWQRINPDALSPIEALFQRFLDSNTPESISSNMSKILAPKNQAVLASSPTPQSGRISSLLRNFFTKPPTELSYEPSDENLPAVRNILKSLGLTSWFPSSESQALREWERITGTTITFYRGGESSVAGFTPPRRPSLIFINADVSQASLASTLLHELVHVAQKDSLTDTKRLYQIILEHISADEVAKIHNDLAARGYSLGQMETEIPAYLVADALTEANQLGFSELAKSAEIKQAFEGWLEELPMLNPSAFKEVADEELGKLASSPAPQAFYSQLAKAIDQKMPKMAPVAQVVAIARDNAKAEEVKWSGIIQAAQELAVDGKVPKDALMKYLADEGSVKFEEVKMDGTVFLIVGAQENFADARDEFESEDEAKAALKELRQRDIDQYLEYNLQDEPTPLDEEGYEVDPNDAVMWRVQDLAGQRQEFSNKEEAQALIDAEREWAENDYLLISPDGKTMNDFNGDEYYSIESGTRDDGSGTKFSQYVLPGGDNYREVVLAMPTQGEKRTPNEIAQARYGKDFYDLTRDQMEKINSEIQRNLKGTGVTYTSSHFPDVPNYVAHMRTNERTDADGNAGLFIEELQSDRHQAGRKQGYKEDTAIRTREQAVAERDEIYRAMDAGEISKEEMIQRLSDWKPFNDSAIADAPFRTTWPLAMFKRALRDAVDSGKDWIGWTVGETQNDRFDLSNQVDSITVKRSGGKYYLRTIKDGEPIGGWHESEAAALSDFIGKDLAEKIVNDQRLAEETTTADPVTYSGIDLKVGGSGMKGFYDNMLPKEIGKYVKQWGGKVEKTELVVSPERKTIVAAPNRPGGIDKVIPAEIAPIWRIDITPEMRAGVAQGQMLFSSPTRTRKNNEKDSITEVNTVELSRERQATSPAPNSQGNLRAEQLIARAKSGASYPQQPEYYGLQGERHRQPWVRERDSSSLQEVDSQQEQLSVWARANGYFIENTELAKAYAFSDLEFKGNEHDVLRFTQDKKQFVIRQTKLDMYGLAWATPAEYLQRWRLSNAVFPDAAASFIGYTENARGNGVILTSQPYFEGVKKPQRVIDEEMGKLGFKKMSGEATSYINPLTKVEIHDAKPDNIIFDKAGNMMPFDVWVNDPLNQYGAASQSTMLMSSPSRGGFFDFGATLAVRKNRPVNYSAEILETDIAKLPLAKLWPKSDVDAIADVPTAAIAHTLRENLPAKPRSDWKLRRWAEKLRAARASMQTIETLGAEEVLSQINRISSHLAAQARILTTLPRERWGRIESVTHYPDSYTYEKNADGTLGARVAMPRAEAVVDGKRIEAKTITELAEKLQAMFAETKETKPAGKPLKFEVRTDRKTYYVMKKGDPLYRHLKDFSTSADAFAYIKGNASDLAAAWEAVKERENVKKTDVRNDVNRPRVGKDWRNGQDATAQMFQDAFGFRGVAFGKWVEQGGNVKERQGMLNLGYDSLMDLANILGIPSRAISLESTLGLAFGADGSGNAAATYNEGSLLINLTKTRGAGTLAHEWFHALDNYFQKKRPGKSNVAHGGNFITYQPEPYYVHKRSGTRLSTSRYKEIIENPKNRNNPDEWERENDPIRPEVSERFAELVKAINDSPMSKRSTSVDKGKADGYWSRIIEKAARSFENYVIYRMMQEGYHNDYLANVTEVENFARDSDLYPYLLPDEIAPVADAFDNLFDAIEAKETPKGTMLMSSPSIGANGRRAVQVDGDRVLEAPGMVLLSSPTAYHGTPHKVDKFSLDKIGSGEGSQAYGWGLYFSQSKEVGEHYRKTLSDRGIQSARIDGGKPLHVAALEAGYAGRDNEQSLIEAIKSYLYEEQAREALEFYGRSMIDVLGDFKERLKKQRVDMPSYAPYYDGVLSIFDSVAQRIDADSISPKGNLYAVTLKVEDEDLLDWDNRHDEYDDIPRRINETFFKRYGVRDYWQGGQSSGAQFYRSIAKAVAEEEGRLEQFGQQTTSNEERLASEFLLAAGIRGIRYLDGNSRVSPLEIQAARKTVESWRGKDADQLRYAEQALAELLKKEAESSYNYVIFDEADIIITEENGQPVNATLLLSSPAAQVDLFAAATAPDASKQLGGVKVGTMNALGAYRTLTKKREKLGSLTATEEQQLLDAEVALGQKLAFDMEALRSQSQPIANESKIEEPSNPVNSEKDRFRQLMLLSSPSPDDTAVQMALDSLLPIHRSVFEAINSGATPQEVMQRFKLTEKAVTNLLNQVRARIEIAMNAEAGTLKPRMKNGKIDGGRPDLALGAQETPAAIDQIRNAAGLPDKRGWDEVIGEVEALLSEDYQGTYDKLLSKARNREQMSDTEVAATKRIIAKETMEGRATTMQERVKVALLINGYREIGTETARALAMRRDPNMRAAERHALFLAEALFSPDAKTRARLRKSSSASQESILAGWMGRVDAIKEELKSRGYDVDASLAAYYARQEEIAAAVSSNPKTAEIINENIRKLSVRQKAVVEALRDGQSTYEDAALLTGTTPQEAKEIYQAWVMGIRAAMAESAKRYLTGTLASSPSGDMMGSILAELGIVDPELIPMSASDRPRVEALKKKRDVATRPAKTKGQKTDSDPLANKKAKKLLGIKEDKPLTTKQLEAIERFVNAEPATWQTVRQETLSLFPELRLEGDLFEQGENARRVASGLLFPEAINETRGVFSLNDVSAMLEVANAFAVARSKFRDKLMDYWRMSILTGPQTHVVNTTSNVLHGAYRLLPRRAVEATTNNLLSLVGLGSKEQATFGEFSAMSKQLRKGVGLAARLALRSWQTEQRLFESYATQAPIQIEFAGAGAERFQPALGGKLGTIMRSLSFRSMTATDEFIKGLFGQIEAAAQAHRIARVEEKLRGTKYEARVKELMEPGSIAWLRALDEANSITFQTKLDGSNPQALNRIDQVANGMKMWRDAPYIGKPLTFFIPFIDTPTNIFKEAVQYTPIGMAAAIIDGTRALNRRYRSGMPEALAKQEAAELYNRARLVKDVTNQTIGVALYFALASLLGDDEDDGLPIITGTQPYKTTKKGERDNSMAVMPEQSIRIGGVTMSYRRFEPFATVLASMIDFVRASEAHGLSAGTVSEWLSGFKNQMQDKTFLQGISNLMQAVDDPERFGTTLTSNIVTGFVPNFVRQPIRMMDSKLRDTAPRGDQGYFESIARSVGYSLVPASAPPRLDVWGNEIKKNRGELLGGNSVTDTAIRIFDPANIIVNRDASPIDLWIYRYNMSMADSKDRIGILPIGNSLSLTPPGKARQVKVPLTPEEQAEANREAGRAAKSILGDNWEKIPLSSEHADRIKDVVSRAQKEQRDRLRGKKIAEITSGNTGL